MQVITNVQRLERYQYFIKHLEIVNIILPDDKFPEKLTPKEIEVLAAFMSQDENLIEDDMFNGVVRKKVMERLNLKPGGLSNHLKSMIDNGFLERNEVTRKITVKYSQLTPEKVFQGFRIKLVKV